MELSRAQLLGTAQALGRNCHNSPIHTWGKRSDDTLGLPGQLRNTYKTKWNHKCSHWQTRMSATRMSATSTWKQCKQWNPNRFFSHGIARFWRTKMDTERVTRKGIEAKTNGKQRNLTKNNFGNCSRSLKPFLLFPESSRSRSRHNCPQLPLFLRLRGPQRLCVSCGSGTSFGKFFARPFTNLDCALNFCQVVVSWSSVVNICDSIGWLRKLGL